MYKVVELQVKYFLHAGTTETTFPPSLPGRKRSGPTEVRNGEMSIGAMLDG